MPLTSPHSSMMLGLAWRSGDLALPDAVGMGWGWETSTTPAPSPRVRLLWRLVKIAAFAALALAIVAIGGFGVFLQTIERYEQYPSTRTDGIVALTGGAQRIGDAIELLGKGYARRLLISRASTSAPPSTRSPASIRGGAA